MTKFRIFLGLMLGSAALPAQAELLLQQTSPRAMAGEPLEMTLTVINGSPAPLKPDLPVRIPVRLIAKDATVDAELSAIPLAKGENKGERGIAENIASGQFRQYRYRIVLPEEVSGPIAIELNDTPGGRLIVMAERPAALAATPERPAGAGVTAALRETDTIAQPALQTFEPMYFVVGRREDVTTARFQLSFKYRLFDEKSWMATLIPPASQLYFGYTQTSLWDLSEPSAPFRDTAYRPSVFYLDPQVWASSDGATSLGIATGLEHESNGRDDLDSRSINIAYVRPTWRQFLNKDWYVSVSPKIFTYLARDNNEDIAQYRGYVDLNLRLGRVDGWLFSADLRKGTRHFGSVQLDASYPIRPSFFANAGGFLHFQYFNGYGESLLDYDVKGPAQFRVGFSIVR